MIKAKLFTYILLLFCSASALAFRPSVYKEPRPDQESNPLGFAAFYGDLEEVKKLIAEGADVNMKSCDKETYYEPTSCSSNEEPYTPLELAVYMPESICYGFYGCEHSGSRRPIKKLDIDKLIEIIHLLVNNGAQIKQEKQNYPLLYLAISEEIERHPDYIRVIEAILQIYSEKNIEINPYAILKVLKGIKKSNPVQTKTAHLFLKNKEDIYSNLSVANILIEHAQNHNLPAIQFLIDNGANINTTNRHGLRVLDYLQTNEELLNTDGLLSKKINEHTLKTLEWDKEKLKKIDLTDLDIEIDDLTRERNYLHDNISTYEDILEEMEEQAIDFLPKKITEGEFKKSFFEPRKNLLKKIQELTEEIDRERRKINEESIEKNNKNKLHLEELYSQTSALRNKYTDSVLIEKLKVDLENHMPQLEILKEEVKKEAEEINQLVTKLEDLQEELNTLRVTVEETQEKNSQLQLNQLEKEWEVSENSLKEKIDDFLSNKMKKFVYLNKRAYRLTSLIETGFYTDYSTTLKGSEDIRAPIEQYSEEDYETLEGLYSQIEAIEIEMNSNHYNYKTTYLEKLESDIEKARQELRELESTFAQKSEKKFGKNIEELAMETGEEFKKIFNAISNHENEIDLILKKIENLQKERKKKHGKERTLEEKLEQKRKELEKNPKSVKLYYKNKETIKFLKSLGAKRSLPIKTNNILHLEVKGANNHGCCRGPWNYQHFQYIENGLDVNGLDANGFRPLDYTTNRGNGDRVNIFIELRSYGAISEHISKFSTPEPEDYDEEDYDEEDYKTEGPKPKPTTEEYIFHFISFYQIVYSKIKEDELPIDPIEFR